MTQTASGEDKPIQFVYTAEDFVAAERLHAWPTRRGWLASALLMLAAAIGLTIALGDAKAALATLLLFALGGLIGGGAVHLLVINWLARRHFRHQPLAHLPITLSLRGDGISTESPRGRSDLLWRDIIRWRTGKMMTLLYLSPRVYLVVPERLTAQGFACAKLRSHLSTAIGAPIR